MNVPQILIRVYARYLETGRVPKAKFDPAVQMESLRKIGKWRKVLWICGLVRNERRRLYPQVRFVRNNKGISISGPNMKILNRFRTDGRRFKDRIL